MLKHFCLDSKYDILKIYFSCRYFLFAEFLLHPYRKPKRIRTAFAPLQLLELENAFEGNQYVVGSERKALAKTLNLTETQVRSSIFLIYKTSHLFLLNSLKIQFIWKIYQENSLPWSWFSVVFFEIYIIF